MRVITGTAGGRKLKTLEGDATRPTSAKVKEGVFSAIQFDIEGRNVLDLFAGSGQMGIEALSRGAQFAVFCDSNPEAIRIIKDNIETVGFSDRARVCQCDYTEITAGSDKRFDIAFIDPPYAAGLLLKAAEAVEKIMSDYGVMILEHPTGAVMPESIGRFALKKSYRYGKTTVALYKRSAEIE